MVWWVKHLGRGLVFFLGLLFGSSWLFYVVAGDDLDITYGQSIYIAIGGYLLYICYQWYEELVDHQRERLREHNAEKKRQDLLNYLEKK